MVILQFNKLIRNKWLWGAFAAVISAAFCFEGCFSDNGDRNSARKASAGLIGGEEVQVDEFQKLTDDIRGLGPNRDNSRSVAEVNAEAWELLAALKVAQINGVKPSKSELREIIRADRSFQDNGRFSFNLYRQRLQQFGYTPEMFEEYLERRISLMRVAEAVANGASWASPAEIEQAVDDMTDAFTVKVAKFSENKEAAKAVKLDDKALEDWYKENLAEIALPERVKIRYIRFNATDKSVLAKMEVSDDEMRDYYDVRSDKYTVTDTNGVEKVKAFEEVKKEIEAELRQIAAINYFETNIGFRVYAKAAAKGKSRLDEIAAEDSLKVETSQYFTLAGSYKEGFMVHSSLVLPGAKNFKEVVAELDPEVEDLKYGIVTSDKAVWLVEKFEVSPAHTPEFKEAKQFVQRRALSEAREKAFRKSVEDIAAKGADAVLATKNVSTNISFVVCDLAGGNVFANQAKVVPAASKLAKGEVSPFVRLTSSSGLLVVCVDRVKGDAAKAAVLRSRFAADVQALQQRQIPELWRKWNLSNIGYQPQPGFSAKQEEIEE